ncbi:MULTISPECIES: DUF930 domain-containing protein [unclassified Phyllobacterium]|uniref:DUF930 domain-containing protein n=1 Tax=Phyllobacterium TaxID=28100 RepID=UPI000DDB296A|nr:MULTISPECIES: DUF930 domain-containing protein [unclassified Phyllobacterium]MBA8900533.1 hypothetical protein [Phyllobacterium sp. P30BS-XVII]UGX86482.1 DUF930 domain-containing protein [Phyllobacterium sp. T1293]
MKSLIAMLLLTIAMTGSSKAMDSKEAEELEGLSPETRLEQRCDLEAMERIHHDPVKLVPDELVAYAFKEPKVTGDKIQSTGAAFRSKGEWYHLSYTCTTSPDHMTILTFQYAIGQMVPHDEWSQHFLVP